MGDVDAGNIKAKASIEYDPSGLKQMKEDLATLPDMIGGLGQSADQTSKQLAANADSAKSFTSALDELPKIVESGGDAITGMTGALEEHQQAVEDTISTYEDLKPSVESVSDTLQKAAPPMQTLSERTQGLNENLSQVQQTFSDLSATVADSGATQAYTELWKSMSGENLGATPLGNFEAFQKAYNAVDSSGMYDAAASMQMIDDHLDRTGQSYEQFTGTLSDKNQQLLHEMSMDWSQMNATMDGTGQVFQTTGADVQKGFSGIATSAGDADKAVSEFLGNTSKSAKMLEPIGFGEAFSGATEGIMGALNDVAMPLMAVQMIAMAVQQAGQAIYDSAAIAEGPGAHSFGTFTGTVDALSQSVQRTGAQFSESFGQGVLPTLNQLNYQMSQTSGGPDLLGGSLGMGASALFSLWEIGTGFNPLGGMQGLANLGAKIIGVPQPFQGPGPEQQAQITYEQQVAQMPQTVRNLTYQTSAQADQLLQMASDPGYLQSQDQLQAAQQAYQTAQRNYNSRNYISPQQALMHYQEQQYDQQQMGNWAYQMQNPTYGPVDIPGYWGGVAGGIGAGWNNFFGNKGVNTSTLTGAPSTPFDPLFNGASGFFGGVGQLFSSSWGQFGQDLHNSFDPIGGLFSGLFGGGAGGSADFFGGCFVAGTPVLMSDGSTKPIETLQVGDTVLAHNGQEQVTTTILALITPPPKRVYKLTLSNGKMLTLTNSHPLATTEGWKSLSPEATAQENPDLSVNTLKIGDSVHTASDIHVLASILPLQGVRQVYNITVDNPHTFYANGVLVHNKMMGGGPSSMTNSGVGSEQVSLSHTFTANIQWAANNLEKQFTGVANWVGQGLSNTFQGIASWVGQGLSNTFQGIANWVGQGLSNTFQGIANWVGQGLTNTFQGIANWVGQGLENTFQGVANWVGSGLTNTFKGVASWAAQGLEHTFNAVANWTAQNLTPNFMVNPSFSMLAEGTSDWPGGPAIVGEAGAEVVEHNGQYSMFDQGAALVNLPSGANVYPMQNLASSSVAQFADGTGNYVLPLPIGLKDQGASAPQSMNIYLQIDGQTFWSATGLSLAQTVRAGSGMRSY